MELTATVQIPIYSIVDGSTAVAEHTVVLDDEFSRTVLAAEHWTLAGGMGSRALRYASTRRGGNTIYLHRLVFCHYYGIIPEGQLIDHRDRDRLNNVPSNLRLATRSINAANSSRKSKPASGITGVYKVMDKPRWYARVMHMYKFKHLGVFSTPEEAARAVNSAYRTYFPGVPVPNPEHESI